MILSLKGTLQLAMLIHVSNVPLERLRWEDCRSRAIQQDSIFKGRGEEREGKRQSTPAKKDKLLTSYSL